MFTYNQKTGSFIQHDANGVLFSATGYSGHAEGKNNPEMQYTHDTGPIPVGHYKIALPITHPKLGPLAFRLIQSPANRMNGRDGFFIHGDSRIHPGEASHGCIVLDNPTREYLSTSLDRLLVVV